MSALIDLVRKVLRWIESDRFRRTYGRKADHSRAYAAAESAASAKPVVVASASPVPEEGEQ